MRQRLLPDRFVRIWSVIEMIEREPGLTRGEIADRFAVSERQMQADLQVIRHEIGLPLVRTHGYRFDTDESAPLGLEDLLALFLLIQAAESDDTFLNTALPDTLDRLARAFPLPLRALAIKVMSVIRHDGFGPGPDIFECLLQALVSRQAVHLRYAHAAPGADVEPTVDPQFLLPYRDTWFLIGRCHQRNRVLMFTLSGLQSATLDQPA